MTQRRKQPVAPAEERLGRALAEHMTDDFEAHGAHLLSSLRDGKPVEYLKLMQSILAGATGKDARGGRQINFIERRIIRPEDPDG